MGWSRIPRSLVVIASFCSQLILEGVVLALDVLPPYVLQYFHATNAEVTLFGSVVHGFSQLLGPLSGAIANRIGDRLLVAVCGVGATLGFLLGSLATKVWQLVLACALVGVSFGFAWVPPVTVVSFHFTTHRHLVTSGTTIGGAVGGAIAPFVFAYLLDTEPWQYCFVIMGCVVLQLVVCGCLLRRPEVQPRQRTYSINSVVEDLSDEQLQRALEKRRQSKTVGWVQTAALPLFLICTLVWHTGYDAFEIMPLRLVDEGHLGQKVPLVISLQAITAIIGRLLAAVLIGRCRFDPTLTFNTGLLFGGLLRVVLSWKMEYMYYLIVVACSGCAFGVVSAAVPSVALELVSIDKLNFVFGLQLLASGIGGLIGPPLAGWLVDLRGTDDYFTAFIVGGMLVLVGTVFMLPYHYPLNQLFTQKVQPADMLRADDCNHERTKPALKQ